MFTKTTWSFALIVLPILAFRATGGFTQETEAEDESPAKLAQQVYSLLLDQYRAGKTGLVQLELLNNWSIRTVLADWSATALTDNLKSATAAQQSVERHFERMRTLEEIVEKSVEAGVARRSDLLAAQHFRRSNTAIEQMINDMQQQLQPPEIKLPAANAKPLGSKPPSIVIDIDANGRFSVQGKDLTIDQLEEQLRKAAKENPESATINIRAHPDCLYANVVQVIDVSTKAGITSIFFASFEDKARK